MQFSTMVNFLTLIRFKNLLILFICQFLIFNFIIDGFFGVEFFCILGSTFFATIGGNLFNDFKDVNTDKINKETVIPFHGISPKLIFSIFVLSFHLSLLLSFSLPLSAIILVGANILVLLSYSILFQKLPLIGNIIVAFLASSSVFIFYLVYETNMREIQLFSILTFFIHLIRELIKDIEDIEGDSKSGYSTFPIRYGIKNSKRVIIFTSVTLAISLFILSIRVTTSLWLYNNIFILPLVGLIVYKTIKASSKSDYTALSKWCKGVMILGLIGVLFC